LRDADPATGQVISQVKAIYRKIEWSLAVTTFAPKPDFQSPVSVPDHDGWIIFGYALFSVVLLAAAVLATGGPGLPDAEFAVALAMP